MVASPVQGPVRPTVLVTGDRLGEESFRVLRIQALWAKLPQVAPKQLPASVPPLYGVELFQSACVCGT